MIIRNFIPFAPLGISHYPTCCNYWWLLQSGARCDLLFLSNRENQKYCRDCLNEDGELTQVETHPDGTFDVLISARNFKGQQTVWIKNYDAEGNLSRQFLSRT